ncbi:hypothetical protein PC119_g19448 [Phytophthora cactorum]|uniref:Uncharacterized protein n=1 Tax=Phytophthora cactorum TaxID=29920 RepID=A0A8T1BSJ9_9STRA|nr:hypothetical protein PC114_g19851 [Phytophthora cactorum]KAG2909595.1 hypothetical protein PC117_g19615 [Phytophthora cactorum]KAG2988864.1 hypothetical protein PC119_g19448 [Phytophthora cactorum]KAG4047431.1 hypothetical protein PC123_g17211 [Phytophthora cactorum]
MPQVSRRQRALRSVKRGIRAALLSENMTFFFDLFDHDDMLPLEVPDPDNDMVMQFIEALQDDN